MCYTYLNKHAADGRYRVNTNKFLQKNPNFKVIYHSWCPINLFSLSSSRVCYCINKNLNFCTAQSCYIKTQLKLNFIEFEREVKISVHFTLKALSNLGQFLATESALKMMKKTFYFTLKAIFVLKIFKLLSWSFGHV